MSRKCYGKWCLAVWGCFFLLLQNSSAAEIHLGVPIPEKTREHQLLIDQVTRIKAQTQGRIDLRLHFSQEGQAGVGKMVKKGQLDGCLAIETDFSKLGLGEESLVYALPFLFRDSDDVAILRAQLDVPLLENMSNDTVTAVGFVDLGFLYFAASSKDLATAENWPEQRFWLPLSDGFAGRRLRSTQLQLSNFEFKRVLDALKNDEVQVVLAPLPLIIMKRWHTRLRCVYSTPIVYSYGIWTVNKSLVDGLDSADSKALYACLQELGRTLEKAVHQRYESSLKVLERYNITFINPSPALSAQHYSWLQSWLPTVQQELNLSARVMQYLTSYVDLRR